MKKKELKKNENEKTKVKKTETKKKTLNKKFLFIIWTIIVFVSAFALGRVSTKLDFEESKEKEIVKEKYTITFDSDGGTAIEEQIVEEGNVVTKPSDPSKEKYIFVEWQLDGGTYDFSAKVKQNITLKAIWQKIKENQKTFTIKFDSNGGSSVSSKTVIEGEKVSKPSNPTKYGYKFIEWRLNGKAYDFSSSVTKGITLKAAWKEDENVPRYTVTFDSAGGSKVSSQRVIKGNNATKPSNPTKSGYKFAGWTLNGSVYNFSTKVTKNITLKATWTELSKFTVTFDSNGGSSVSNQTVTEGTQVKKPSNPTKSGYKFVAWTLNGKTYNFSNKVTGNITLKATWKQNSYTIKATAVDAQSPARVLSVYENGTKISVKSIKYTDGTTLCSGSNMNVNKYALDSTTYKVVLNSGTEVTATLVS